MLTEMETEKMKTSGSLARAVRKVSATCLLMSAAGCGYDSHASIVDPGAPSFAKAPPCAGVPSGTSSLQIAPSAALTIGIGATRDYTVTNQAGIIVPDCALSWSTSNSKIATVSSTGLATGKALGGPVRIKAQTIGKPSLTTSALLSVGSNIASISVAPSSFTLVLGTSGKLIPTILDTKGNTVTNRYVTWTSSNPLVGTVSSDATITSIAVGTFTVVATVEGKTATSTIHVTNPLASSGWMYWSTTRHYYKFVAGSPTWDDARTQAAATNIAGFSAQLASLATAGESAFVINYLNTLPIQASGRPYIWFGLYQNVNSAKFSEPTGGWEWLSGELFDDSVWGDGEPNNATIYGPENCAAMNWYLGSPLYNGTFVDYACSQTFTLLGYVVEITPNP